MQTDKKYILYFTTFGAIIFLTTTMPIVRADDLTAAKLTEFSDTTHELIGYCAPYHGKVCRSFITSAQVWYSNVSVTGFNFVLFGTVSTGKRDWIKLLPLIFKHIIIIIIIIISVCQCVYAAGVIHTVNVTQTGRPRRWLEKWTNHHSTLGRINSWIAWIMPCRRWGKYFIMGT